MTKQKPLNSAQAKTELVVIINSFNRFPLLREALLSVSQVLEHTPIQSAIIVFEAGSTDGSVEFIEKFSVYTQNIQIICLHPGRDIDHSFSAGCNQSVQFATKQFPKLKWCFFFETDNLMTNETALLIAVKLLETEEQLAAVGFTVERYDGQKAGFGRCFPTPLAFLVGQQLSQALGLDNMPIKQWYPFADYPWSFCDIVFTSPLLVKYSAWESIGGMDTVRFPYSDCDSDWCWRAYEKGWRVAVLDIPGVIHDNRNQSSAWSGNRVIDFHQARLGLLLKHRGNWIATIKLMLFLRHCLEFLILIFLSFHDQRAKKSLNQRIILMKTVFNNYKII